MQITKEMTLNQVTDAFPGALKILGDLGLDTCCGGWEPIGQAAEHKGIPFEKIVAALEPITKGA